MRPRVSILATARFLLRWMTWILHVVTRNLGILDVAPRPFHYWLCILLLLTVVDATLGPRQAFALPALQALPPAQTEYTEIAIDFQTDEISLHIHRVDFWDDYLK